ncbi:hypothetical protein AKJ16_DCAP06598 [Drosera capensis]
MIFGPWQSSVASKTRFPKWKKIHYKQHNTICLGKWFFDHIPALYSYLVYDTVGHWDCDLKLWISEMARGIHKGINSVSHTSLIPKRYIASPRSRTSLAWVVSQEETHHENFVGVQESPGCQYVLSNWKGVVMSKKNRFWSPPDRGQRVLSSTAYDGANSLCLKLVHLESPISDKVDHVESLLIELGEKALKSASRRRNVVVRAGHTCSRGVPSSQWYFPAWPSGLHITEKHRICNHAPSDSHWVNPRQQSKEAYVVGSHALLDNGKQDFVQALYLILTKTVESLAAMMTISAQDTVSGHSFSSADLISSMTSKPRTECLFGIDLFSLTMVLLLSRSSDASHPYKET